MANTTIPSQLGYTAPNSNLRSQIVLGKYTKVEFEAIGLGADSRPDSLEALKIYISEADGNGNSTTKCVLHLDITDVLELTAASNYPSTGGAKDELFLKLREVAVCEQDDDGETTEKRMIILGSQTYDAPTT